MNGLAKVLNYRTALLVPVVLFVGSLAVIPPFYLLWSSFKPITLGNISDFSLSNFTLENYIDAFSDPTIFITLIDSFFFAGGSMLVALLFGGMIAFLVERTNVPMRNLTYGLMLIPLIMPSMLKAIGWILLINPNNGILNLIWFSFGFEEPIFNAYSIPAMFWVEGLSMSPLTFLLLGSAFRGMDPSLEEAAFTSGAGKVLTFFKVTLKLMTPAIAGIALLQFIRGLEAFEVPFVMGSTKGIHVFSTNIYVSIKEISPPRIWIRVRFESAANCASYNRPNHLSASHSQVRKVCHRDGKGIPPSPYLPGKMAPAGRRIYYFLPLCLNDPTLFGAPLGLPIALLPPPIG